MKKKGAGAILRDALAKLVKPGIITSGFYAEMALEGVIGIYLKIN